jgi:branched-chain amino acid transport system permease protein
VVTNFRKSASGRMLIAVKDNDKAARSQGITATGTRLTAFALSGFLCACGGVVFAYSYQRFTGSNFLPDSSLAMVTMTIIGGQGSIIGAILGPLFVFGIPVVFYGAEPNSLVPFVVGAGGGLIMLMFFPRGLAGLVFELRDLLIRLLVPGERAVRPLSARPTIREIISVALGRDGHDPAPSPAVSYPEAPLGRQLVNAGAEGDGR